jgi:surface antigen
MAHCLLKLKHQLIVSEKHIMRKMVILLATASISVATLSGCNVTKQDWGIVGGAVIGGALAPVVFGNSAWYTIAGGAAAGAWVGSYFGRGMDSNDRSRVGYTLNNAPDKQPYKFMRSEKDSDLTVMPTRSYKVGNQLCRDFQTTLTDTGKTVYDKGSACQTQDGKWQIRA